MADVRYFDSPKAIEAWIKAEHQRRHPSEPIAYGVGNNMDYPVVVWRAPWAACYYPDGINSELVFCEVGQA